MSGSDSDEEGVKTNDKRKQEQVATDENSSDENEEEDHHESPEHCIPPDLCDKFQKEFMSLAVDLGDKQSLEGIQWRVETGDSFGIGGHCDKTTIHHGTWMDHWHLRKFYKVFPECTGTKQEVSEFKPHLYQTSTKGVVYPVKCPCENREKNGTHILAYHEKVVGAHVLVKAVNAEVVEEYFPAIIPTCASCNLPPKPSPFKIFEHSMRDAMRLNRVTGNTKFCLGRLNSRKQEGCLGVNASNDQPCKNSIGKPRMSQGKSTCHRHDSQDEAISKNKEQEDWHWNWVFKVERNEENTKTLVSGIISTMNRERKIVGYAQDSDELVGKYNLLKRYYETKQTSKATKGNVEFFEQRKPLEVFKISPCEYDDEKRFFWYLLFGDQGTNDDYLCGFEEPAVDGKNILKEYDCESLEVMNEK